MERLLTAYQEDLLSLDELRRRMPGLRQREQSLQGELQALRDRTAEEAAMLRLSETLASFLKRLRETAESLDIAGRQKILRLLVKEVLVDKDSITIRHSIPIPRDPDDLDKAEDATLDRSSPASPGYLLRSGSGHIHLGAFRFSSCRIRLPTIPRSRLESGADRRSGDGSG